MNARLKTWWDSIRASDARNVLVANRNDVKACPFCDGNVEDRVISIYAELAGQLYSIYRWCGEKRVHEFTMKDVRHLLDHNGYNRFNDLIRCSNGILYRPVDESGDKKARGNYGMHMARAKEFFAGTRPIHLQVSLNPITREKTVLKDVMVRQIPPLTKMLDENGIYDYERLL